LKKIVKHKPSKQNQVQSPERTEELFILFFVQYTTPNFYHQLEDEMRKHIYLFVLFTLLSALVLGACGGAASAPENEYIDTYQPVEQSVVEMPAAAEEPQFEAGGFSSDEAAKAGGDAALPVGPVYNTGSDIPPGSSNHLIIKTADIKLLVEDTDNAIERTTQVVGDTGGYIVSSRIWYQGHYDGKNYKYATITMGVPVNQFERAMNRLRGLAVEVLDENASGEDVTDQYVDLESQLANLEATRERIKSFLDEAKTVDEALRINQQLTEVEQQIEQIKGRMNYLEDRSAFSTITVNIEPKLPDLEPTPTPVPEKWNPGKTFDRAKDTIIEAYQGIIDLLIWVAIVVLPLLTPPVFLIWLLWKFFTRKSKNPPSSEK